MPIDDAPTLYRQMARIRRFEETVLENFSRGLFFGTTHTYLGQEANAVGVLAQQQPQDIICSNHRCHGHFISAGGDLRALFAELMGRQPGVCAGRGGSQHLHWNNFYSNGVQGGLAPIAVGMAVAERLKGSSAIVFAFIGDGTLGEGVVYEAFNMATLWQAPLLFIVENNQIAQTTPVELALAGDIALRFQAFGIQTLSLDSSDVLEIAQAAQECTARVRDLSQPQALIIKTCRFGPHSKGDDTRPAALVEKLHAERDPLLIHADRLPGAARETIDREVEQEVESSFLLASADPFSLELTLQEPLLSL